MNFGMNPMQGTNLRVTIVMTARERHSLTEAAIASVVAETSGPYRFLYLDVQSPDWLREILASRSSEGQLEVVRIDEPLWPQQARTRVIDAIETEYVVFIDNDVQVEAGWLDSLVACADATGAGIVGPLYLAGDGLRPPKIHMAGGKLIESAGAGGRVLEEVHVLADEDPRRVATELSRHPCDFVEYHCMLIRTELLRASVLDPGIRCVHEHIDTSLAARQRGLQTYVEPTARVSYLGLSEFMLDDLAFFRERWSSAEAEASIEAFCRKWNVINDDRSFGGTRCFLRDHVAQVDPIRCSLRDATMHQQPMGPEELRQSRSDLLDLAAARGYAHDELALIANSYHVAHILMDGGYRPCGRPFINHLVGTASVLVRYGFRAETVAAGLLHSAYTHCPAHQRGIKAGVDAVCSAIGGKGSAVERRVRNYTLRESGAPGAGLTSAAFSTLSVPDAEVVAIVAANELDMHLSGEFRYSGRTDAIDADAVEQIARVSRVLGVEGLYESLRLARDRQTTAARAFLSNVQYSYRIGSDKRSAVPMATNAQGVLT
jgi:GT2 family glycosyltransferase